MIPTKQTALLVFIRSAREESLAKQFSFLGNQEKNEAIAECLNQNIIAEAKKTGLPYYIFSSENQIGDNFGTRLSNAFESVFNKGFEKVIAIGNDCLDLNAKVLRATHFKLEQCHSVIGPSKDGGVYLLGLSRNIFEKDSFESLSWETETLFEELWSYTQGLNSVTFLLPTSFDVDCPKDLKKALAQISRFSSLHKQFARIFKEFVRHIFSFQKELPSLFSNSSRLLRAPPF